MEKLKERYINENTGIEYVLKGDYYVPNLVLTGTEKDITLSKYGRMRARFLRENQKAEYTILLMENKLQEHLLDVDKTANDRLNLIIRTWPTTQSKIVGEVPQNLVVFTIKQLAERENVTEELKATNQMEWVKCMNNIKNCAEEIVLKELIYI